MEIDKRIEYVTQHIAAIASDIDQTHSDCDAALLKIAQTAQEAIDNLMPTRDAALRARRAQQAAKDEHAKKLAAGNHAA
jgi:hypothetical protein